MESKPLSGILMLTIAVGLAVAWSRGYLTGVMAKISEGLAGPVRANPIVLRPITGGRIGGSVSAGRLS